MGMLIDMPIATQAIDSSGEQLLIENVDLTDFHEGKAFANFEHQNGKPDDIVGIFKYAKKILKASDCETDRQRQYWDKIKLPFIYGICELFTDEDHPGAIAIASIIRYFAKRKEPIQVGASIEGVTVKRDGNILERAIARKTAITLKPCNKQCWVDLIGEDELSEVVKKFESNKIATVEIDSIILEDNEASDNSLVTIRKALSDLNKTLTASGGNVAPAQLVGGAALARESISGTIKNRLKAAVRDWDRKRPLKETIKAALPEVSDEYVNHFTDLAEDIALKKAMPLPKLHRVGNQHGHSMHDDDQQKLIEGLYVDNDKLFTPTHNYYSPENKKLLRLRNDANQDVILKIPKSVSTSEDESSMDPSDMRHAMAYHHIAKNFFGMGQHVPVTSVLNHPRIAAGKDIQAIEFTPGSTPFESHEAWNKIKAADTKGTLHKLAAMDQILGLADRHEGNIIIGADGYIKHIDNDRAFSYPSGIPHDYLNADNNNRDIIHPEAVKWLMTKNPVQLAQHMKSLGLDNDQIKKSVTALKAWQQYAKKGYPANQIHYNVDGLLAATRSIK